MGFEDERELLNADQAAVARKAAAENAVGISDVQIVGGCSQLSLPPGLVASTVVSLRLDDLTPVAASFAVVRTDFEYKATYLVYREGPALIKAMDSLGAKPEVLLVPGVGVHHPRGVGMARHVGYLLSMPTIGVSRRPLSTNLYAEGGSQSVTPRAFRPGRGRGRIYLSRGWGIDASTSEEMVRLCMRDHRLPEPIYIAKRICGERCAGLSPSGRWDRNAVRAEDKQPRPSRHI